MAEEEDDDDDDDDNAGGAFTRDGHDGAVAEPRAKQKIFKMLGGGERSS